VLPPAVQPQHCFQRFRFACQPVAFHDLAIINQRKKPRCGLSFSLVYDGAGLGSNRPPIQSHPIGVGESGLG
jgi:hypothetical protein